MPCVRAFVTRGPVRGVGCVERGDREMYADSPRSATSTPLAAAESDSIGCPVTPSFSFVFAFGHLGSRHFPLLGGNATNDLSALRLNSSPSRNVETSGGQRNATLCGARSTGAEIRTRREEGIMLPQRCLSLLHPSSLDWHPYLTIMAPLLPEEELRMRNINYVFIFYHVAVL